MLYQTEHDTQCRLTVLHSHLVPTSCTKSLTPAWRPSRKVKPGEILSAVLTFLKLSVRSPPLPLLSRFPALSPLCYTDNVSEVKQLVVTEGHVLQAVESWVIKMQLILVTSTCYGLPYLPGTMQQRHTLHRFGKVTCRMS